MKLAVASVSTLALAGCAWKVGAVAVPANATTVTLSWQNFAQTEDTFGGDAAAASSVGLAVTDKDWDFWFVEVSTDGGTSWTVVFEGQVGQEGFWSELSADLSAYAGQNILIRFSFNTDDDESNNFLGWYLENGPRLAAWLRQNPEHKPALRAHMDAILQSLSPLPGGGEAGRSLSPLPSNDDVMEAA